VENYIQQNLNILRYVFLVIQIGGKMLDELWDEMNPIAFAVAYSVGLLILLYLRKQWIGTSMELGWIKLLLFAVFLAPVTYLILHIWANKD